MTGHGIYTETEMMARHEIHMEKYCKVIRIEAETLLDMIQRSILGAVSAYTAKLAKALLQKKAAVPGLSCKTEELLVSRLSALSDDLLEKAENLRSALDSQAANQTLEARMNFYHDVVVSQMDAIRPVIDQLETLTASDFWPYPTYTELLFSV